MKNAFVLFLYQRQTIHTVLGSSSDFSGAWNFYISSLLGAQQHKTYQIWHVKLLCAAVCKHMNCLCFTASRLKCAVSFMIFQKKEKKNIFWISSLSTKSIGNHICRVGKRTLSMLLVCWSTVCDLKKPRLHVLLSVSVQGLVPQTLHACLSKLSHLTPHTALSISALRAVFVFHMLQEQAAYIGE